MNSKIQDYSQKISIFAILCSKSSKYYSFYKNILVFPNIFIGITLTMLNSIFTDINDIKYANIILNAVSTLLIALDKSFQFSEKASLFHKSSISFTTLSHSIDKYNVQPHDVDINDFLNKLIDDYDNLIDNLSFEFPSSVIEDVIKQFDGNNVQLPLIVFTSSNANISQFINNQIHPDVSSNSVFIQTNLSSSNNVYTQTN